MSRADPHQARKAIAEIDLWYHVIEVAPGVTTPGWFDLRPVVDRMPWPDLRGKRCLDVGPYDGFLAFEMERRGAAEVVASDIGSANDWDWPLRNRRSGPDLIASMSGGKTGAGFEVAKRLLDSNVIRVEVSAYDLSPDTVGTFDFIACGSLMLHLRDPVRALEAIRSVCAGQFLSAEQVNPGLSLIARERPLAWFRGGERCQWWIPNAAGHREMVRSAGFEIERSTQPYAIPLGQAHIRKGARRSARRSAITWAATRGSGLTHAACLARPDRTQDP